MSDQHQGPPIDQSKMIDGRRAMTQSHQKERQSGHIPKRGRGKGRLDGSGDSQDTQPEQSQVVDPTQEVEYLNFQDEIHQDVTDGGYDQQHIPQQPIPDQDDIARMTAPTTLPLALQGPG